jgi:methylmalonyl-CoA mutase
VWAARYGRGAGPHAASLDASPDRLRRSDPPLSGEGETALAAAFKASGAALACLCSTDDIYAREAEAAARALVATGAKRLCLAGRPGEREAAYRAAGVQAFVYAGCDALKTLEDAYDSLRD